MQYIQERRKRLSRHLANLSFIHQRFIKRLGRILLLHLIVISITPRRLLPIPCLLLRHFPRNVEPHLHQLVPRRRRLPPPILRMPGLFTVPIRTIRLRLRIQIELHGDLVLARLIRIRDLRVRDLKSRSILHVESQLRAPELRLPPVPPPKRMLLVLDCSPVPEFKRLDRSIEVLPIHVSHHLISPSL